MPRVGAPGEQVGVRKGIGDVVRSAILWLVERRLVLATGLAAALPIIASTAEVVAAGWVPLADDALIAVSAFDVLTPDSPLLGPWSSGYSAVVDEPTFHPGPLLFWLLAVPARLPWPGALELTVGLVNLASVMGIVGLAHRRGGRPLMLVVAIAIPLMLASLPAEAYSDIWNPSAPLLPFTLLIFLAWSLACGDYRLLPLTVLVASFLPQGHLAFLPPALGVLAVGLGGLALWLRDARCAPPARSDRAGTAEGASVRLWVMAAILVGVVCWSAPAIDQATNRPGNLQLIYRAVRADQTTVGWVQGRRAVVRAVGVVPWWLREPQAPLERIADLVVAPGPVAKGSAVLMLGALAAVTILGWRRRRPDIWAAGALGLVLCAALALVTASAPENSAPTLGYTLRWGSPAGMWVWLALGWSLATLLRPARHRETVRRPPLAFAGLLVVAVVAAVVAVSGELMQDPYAEMRTIADRLEAELPPQQAVRIDVASSPDTVFTAWGFQSGIVYALRRDGRRVTVPAVADYLGPEYGPGSGGYEQIVRVYVDTPPPPGDRVVARLTVTESADPAGAPFAPKTPPKRALAVTLMPVRADR
ncbi:MAG: hypothetical protein H0T69_06990 [Thermoleophilaceae bacterium]|nr:hypothetical protein [Thermoleophilaceae bacterium]